MRSKPAICYIRTQCLIHSLLIAVITGTSTPPTLTSIVPKYSDKIENRIDSKTVETTVKYVNQTLNNDLDANGLNISTTRVKSRAKRSIVQLAAMIRCVTGCDPFSYKSYGCYCGYMGAGVPVDFIDRCCWEHDWCYTHAACPQVLVYFKPYEWSCIAPGYSQCGNVPFGGVKERCAHQLCQCDRAFAKCLSRMPCPYEKPICESSPIIAVQNIIVG